MATRPVVDHGRCEAERDCVPVCPYDVFEVRRMDPDDFTALGMLGKLRSTAHRRMTAYTVRADQCHDFPRPEAAWLDWVGPLDKSKPDEARRLQDFLAKAAFLLLPTTADCTTQSCELSTASTSAG